MKRITGTVRKLDHETLQIVAGSNERRVMLVPDSATIYLNAQPITFAGIQDGRQATVRYVKSKGKLFAKEIDVFPTHSDV